MGIRGRPVGAKPLNQTRLKALIHGGLSQAEIAQAMGCSGQKVHWWLRRYGLKTSTRRGPRSGLLERKCRFCDETDPTKFPTNRTLVYTICSDCRNKKYRLRNRKKRRQVVEALGGCCKKCGYDRCLGALHLHHR